MNYKHDADVKKEKKTILLLSRFEMMRKKLMMYSAGRYVPYTLKRNQKLIVSGSDVSLFFLTL